MGILESIVNFFQGRSERRRTNEVQGQFSEPWRHPVEGLSKIQAEIKDEHLRDIVSTILEMNNRLISLERALTGSRPETAGLPRAQRVNPASLFPRSIMGRQPIGDTSPLPQEVALARDKIEKEIRFVGNFLSKCEAMLGFLSRNKKTAAELLERDCKSVFKNLQSRLRNLDPFGISDPPTYGRLSETLRSIPLTEISLHLCSLVEDELEGKQDKDTGEIFRAMAELAHASNLVLINPELGARCNENEHEVISQERGGRGLPVGSVAKVHARGFKSNSGAILKKARISIVM